MNDISIFHQNNSDYDALYIIVETRQNNFRREYGLLRLINPW